MANFVRRVASKVPVPASVEQGLDDALDRALSVQRRVVISYVNRHRTGGASPAELITTLEKRYRAAVIGIGAASGGAAAVPGVGTAVSVASGVAEVAAFIEATALFTLAVAEVHGLQVSDAETRRALVVAVLLGETGAAALESATGGSAKHWVAALREGRPKDTGSKIGHVNQVLARHLVSRFGARQGALLVGRAMPLGIGAGIGAMGNAALAKHSITTARKLFGPPPGTFPPQIVDVPPGRTV